MSSPCILPRTDMITTPMTTARVGKIAPPVRKVLKPATNLSKYRKAAAPSAIIYLLNSERYFRFTWYSAEPSWTSSDENQTPNVPNARRCERASVRLVSHGIDNVTRVVLSE